MRDSFQSTPLVPVLENRSFQLNYLKTKCKSLVLIGFTWLSWEWFGLEPEMVVLCMKCVSLYASETNDLLIFKLASQISNRLNSRKQLIYNANNHYV